MMTMMVMMVVMVMMMVTPLWQSWTGLVEARRVTPGGGAQLSLRHLQRVPQLGSPCALQLA